MNEKKENRVLVTGMTSDVPITMRESEMRNWIKEIVAKTLEKIIPDPGK